MQDERTVQKLEVHLTIDAVTIDAVDRLAVESGLSRQAIKRAMQKGAVWLSRGKKTQRLRRSKRALQPGDELHLYYDSHVLNEQPPKPELIADEGDYSIWYKPYGLRSQGSKWGDHCTINRQAEQLLLPQRPAFVVHRLDRAATGLIIIAHSRKMAAAFSRMFRERRIEKRYQVVVHGKFEQSETPFTVIDPLEGKSACSHFTLVDYDPALQRSVLDVSLETGRKHQIRRHLAGLGYPVVGDRLYGVPGDDENLQLMACFLAFECPLTGTAKQYRLEKNQHS
jgi:tRNA pseudouridine32 synthase/23S rRNA pseudouridine746 synthase